MTPSAIILMVVAITLVWGGLVASIVALHLTQKFRDSQAAASSGAPQQASK